MGTIEKLLSDFWGAIIVGVVGAFGFLIRRVLTNETEVRLLQAELARYREDILAIRADVKELVNYQNELIRQVKKNG